MTKIITTKRSGIGELGLLLALTLAMAMPGARAEAADDADLFSSKMPPNVLLVVDNSSSMLSSIFHPAFDPDVNYEAVSRCNDNELDGSPWNFTFGPSGTGSDHPSGTDLTFCGYTRKVPGLDTNHDLVDDDGLGYYGNYLYWYFSDAVEATYDIDGDGVDDGTIYDQILSYRKSWSGCRTSGEFYVFHRDRATAARQILEEVICQVNRNGKIRFGLASFRHSNAPNGGFVRVPVEDATWDHDNDPQTPDVDKTYALDGVSRTHTDHLYHSAETFTVDSNTPLGETLFQLYTYFMSRDPADLPFGDTDKDGTPDASAGQFPVYQYVTDPNADYGGRNVNSALGLQAPPCPVQEWCQKNFVIMVTDGEPWEDDFSQETGGSYGQTAVGFDRFEDLIGNYKDNVGTTTPQCNGHQCYYLDDIAKFMQEHDFLPNDTLFQGKQKIDVYTIGFATQASLNNFLQATADAGGGSFNASGDPDELSRDIIDALQDIIEKSQVFTAPTVPASRSASGNNFYLSYFKPADKTAFWEGHLKLFDLTAAGEVKDRHGNCIFRDPDNPGTVVCFGGILQVDADPFWDAADQMPASGARKLFVSKYQSGPPATIPSTPEPFSEGNLDELDLGIGYGELPLYDRVGNGTTGIDDVTELKDAVIRYVRGCEFGDGPCVDRAHRLGDIFHSSPIPVDPPGAPIANLGYRRFAQEYGTRTKVIYAGTNGGFVHGFNTGNWQTTPAPGAFDRGTGRELFGFMPYPARQNIKTLPYDLPPRDHYYVDGSPSVADVWMYPTETAMPGGTADWTSWHTVLIGGMRSGGEVIYALDVTNPDGVPGGPAYPSYLWEFPCEDATDPLCTGTGVYPYADYMGETWSQPIITRVKMESSCSAPCAPYVERWVAIFGAGYHEQGDPNEPTGAAYDATLAPTTSRKGRAVFMVDITSGKLLAMKRFDTNTSEGDPTMRYAFAASPAVYDVDVDGFADVVYIGDLGGQLWKWVINTPAEDTIGASATGNVLQPGWHWKRIFAADPCPAATCGRLRTKAFYSAPTGTVFRGQLYLAFGSGERSDLGYIGTYPEERNRFYVVKDIDPLEKMPPPAPPAVDPDPRYTDGPTGAVQPVSNFAGNCTPPVAPAVGFYYEGRDGEKFVTDGVIFAGGVLVGSFEPSSSTSGCDSSGDGYLYYFDLYCGQGKWDDPSNPGTGATVPRKWVGHGPPTAPKVSMGELDSQGDGGPCDNMVFDFSSDGDGLVDRTDCLPSSGVRMRSWRDLD